MVGDGDVCDKPVKEVKSLTFTPELQDAESADLTQKFAEYVTKAAQFSRACEEALTEMLVTGIAGTIIMGFLWVVFLWLFAGVIVFVALTVLVSRCSSSPSSATCARAGRPTRTTSSTPRT